jgi:hypothetical protein
MNLLAMELDVAKREIGGATPPKTKLLVSWDSLQLLQQT